MSEQSAAAEEFRPFDSVGAGSSPAGINRLVEWLVARRSKVLIAAIAFQAVVLLSMIVLHAAPYLFGRTIQLKIVPVDPRDMFRGDYVILSYDINQIPPAGVEGLPNASNQWWRGSRFSDNDWLSDREVFVTLEPDADGKFWHGTKASIHRPAEGVYIRGRYAPGQFRGPLRFGIEAFYVQEGAGKDWEKERNARTLAAEIALAPWGQAKLSRLVKEEPAGQPR